MRPLGVVIDPPRLDAFPRVGQREEPAGIETLSSDAGVESFDERIVGRRPWPREVELDTVQIGPLVEQATGELRAVAHWERNRAGPGERREAIGERSAASPGGAWSAGL